MLLVSRFGAGGTNARHSTILPPTSSTPYSGWHWTWTGFMILVYPWTNSTKTAINTTSPPQVITAGIERSGFAPLCIYHYRDRSSGPIDIPEELQSCTRVQTLRSQNNKEYPLYRRLLRDCRPALHTLQLTGPYEPSVDPIEPVGDLPSIRHITAQRWLPPSDATWLAGLKELDLCLRCKPDTELFRVLSTCANLERLTISGDDMNGEGVQELPGVKSSITLPRLQNMCLKFRSHQSAIKLIGRLITPQCLRRTLVIGSAQGLGQYVGEYRQFMSLEKRCPQYPRSACIHIEGLGYRWVSLEYETEGSQVDFRYLTSNEVQAARDVVQEFQDLFKGPLLTVTFSPNGGDAWLFLRLLNDQNILTIVARLRHDEQRVADLLEVIGALSPRIPYATVTNTVTDWPFKSLRSIDIHEAKVDLVDFIGLVEMYLHKSAKPLLEKIILVGCSYSGMELAEAAERIAAIGITLRGVECHYEE